MITRGSNLSSWKFLEADFRSANTAYSGPDVDTGKVRAPKKCMEAEAFASSWMPQVSIIMMIVTIIIMII